MNFFERGLRCLGKLNPLRLDPNRSYRGGAEQLENLLDISRINPLNSRNGGNNPVVHTFEELAGQGEPTKPIDSQRNLNMQADEILTNPQNIQD
ncbi:hypothetical protein A3J20_05575 [Candidatus Gottesmanbacteria bacterium RIFCSPLOWO2_02_FULL_42_29]|uniref:Uncharacterized protein n=2 Tax=Candidatus Gottesmaniibacteriota TaxID=1752720 RepID=A0A1F6BJX9_9BACT|nr:MAG: hypothetical protein UV09_C0008G0037 [Candidatus Gottesmanbacteria bacterium GW2011_GWA2_42_18]KKS74686.1 MAG: hypothetical protein UV46_C0037G0005 [Candidatus Gottesmanbacteria bacterium GW2011_GWC2_42_8]OGG10709.1 MAG: hypothetical protein A2781_07310 [Candidatus Gottesmanbacteria bacterium RIFCSPHIGHO2_01_FULL_42_27]OGG20149.1 MAG: hypothetical protein A3E72_01165 [Candidatus Gottesmanbacteria bacterium RIFCSPHIGHO2_12_FULL_43_26]OGG34316.1 MAG: hypothetical protein A3G68_05095 [Cand